MRCLHCGKALPLVQRLLGREFCSYAHRKEYQQEFSQLALRRLQQATPSASGSSPFEEIPPAPPAVPAWLEPQGQPAQRQTAQTQSAQSHTAAAAQTTPIQSTPIQTTPTQSTPSQAPITQAVLVARPRNRRPPPVVPHPRYKP